MLSFSFLGASTSTLTLDGATHNYFINMHHLINISQDLVSDELSADVQSYCFSGFFSEHRIHITLSSCCRLLENSTTLSESKDFGSLDNLNKTLFLVMLE